MSEKILKIVLAPDSFKGSISATKVCEAMSIGIRKVFPNAEILSVPLADGGEGTVDALVKATNGRIEKCRVINPIGEEIEAKYGVLGDKKTVAIEMAAASGISLIPEGKRNPLHTTTYGTGQLILNALKKGYKNFIIGIGGSATNDGGAGMAQALGVKFLDENGREITEYMNGDLIGKCKSISVSSICPEIKKSKFTAACDVNNPLLGPDGATYVYGKQKGGNSTTIAKLEENMKNLYDIIESKLNIHVRDKQGAGAAGGLGAALMTFLSAELKTGIEIILMAVNFNNKIKDADIIFTGEGKIDRQTLYGKTISGVLKTAMKNSVPVIAIAGEVDIKNTDLYSNGLKAVFSICPYPMTTEEAMKNSSNLITWITEQICRVLDYQS